MTSPISSYSGSLWKVSWGWSSGMLASGWTSGSRRDGPRGVVGIDLGESSGLTSGQQTGALRRTSPESAPQSPSAPLQIAPQTLSVLTLRLPLCNPTGSPLHDLREPQRKPEDSRDKDGREKGGKEKGAEGDGKRHTGHRRVLLNEKPPRCRGEQPRGSIERFDQSGSLDQFFLLVRVN